MSTGDPATHSRGEDPDHHSTGKDHRGSVPLPLSTSDAATHSRGEDPDHLRRVEIPKAATIEGSHVNIHKFHFDRRQRKLELLKQGVHLAYQLPPLGYTVHLHGVAVL